MAAPGAGYSGTPLPQKLGLKEGHRAAFLHAPRSFAAALGPLPLGVRATRGLHGSAPLDVLVFFVKEHAQFERQLPALRRRMADHAGLWIAWPKKSSGVATDMNEHVVRQVALPTGLVDNKVCAIDETWSGLRLVIRLENRGQ